MHFLLTGLSIVLIDLLLAGDNALVIALAVRSLAPAERRIGIIGGAGVAVVLRIGLTVVAARLLNIEFLQIIGGILIIWIALKVLIDASDPPETSPAPQRFWQAIGYIVLADVTMSVDNILAIAGASKGHVGLIVFGLCLSIPFVVFSSNLLSKLMDRYSFAIYLGAGILGKVGSEMILTDHFVVRKILLSQLQQYLIEAVVVLAVLAVGRWICGRRAAGRCAPQQLS